MSKKILKRSLALGALMAFVITGSASAARVLVNNDGTLENPVKYSEEEYNDCSTTSGSGGAVNNTGVIVFDNCKFNNNTLDKSTAQGGAIYNTGNLTVTNSEFIGNEVKGSGRAAGAAIYNNGGVVTVDNCYFSDNVANGSKSAYGSVIGTTGNGTTTVINSVFEGNAGGTSNGLIYATAGSTLVLEGNTFTGNDRACVSVAAGAEITLSGQNTFSNNTNNSFVVNGTAIFEENSNTSFEDGSAIDFGGNGNIVVEDGATVKSEAGILANGDFELNGTLEVGANSTIKNLGGENGTIKFIDDIDLKVENNESEGLAFTATGEVNDAVGGDASELLKNVALNGEAQMIMEEGNLQGEKVVTFNEDKEVVSETQKVNTKSDAVSDAGMTLKGHWRAHMNDMNKRMGELRMANGEHGVWARMVRGESEYQGAKMQYNQYQLGYDEKLSVDKRWTVGVAVTFSEGDSSYGSGNTDDKSTAFAIYGSKLNNDGTFVDLIARYAHLESDLDDRNYGTGDYSTNGMSVSAEFGKRIQQGNGLWIEPQVELTYGTVDSADVAFSKSYKAHYDSMDSFIARAGFALGKDIKQGNVYARASYLYDFDGETETQFVGGDPIKEDFGGGWWEVGVGANINLSKATYIYADIEKTFGGEVDTNWQWNLGVRYSF